MLYMNTFIRQKIDRKIKQLYCYSKKYPHYLGLDPKTVDHWQSPQNCSYIAL